MEDCLDGRAKMGNERAEGVFRMRIRCVTDWRGRASAASSEMASEIVRGA